MNIETVTGLMGFIMWLSPAILANFLVIHRISEAIETRIPEKYRGYTWIAVSWLWVVIGIALMAVSV